VSIPLDQISALKFSRDHETATVSLQNGDKLQGSVDLPKVELTTLFGKISVGMETVAELQVQRHGAGRNITWVVLPWPRNCDWPGSRGEPAKVVEDGIILHGQPVRTREHFTLPVTVECEVKLEEDPANDGFFLVRVFPAGEAVPLDLEQDECFEFVMGYRKPAAGTGQDALSIQHRWQVRPSRFKTVWGETPFPLSAGEPYKLKLELLADKMRITINDRTFEAEGVAIPYKEFQIQLDSWQPANRWRLRHLIVRQ
jgi:hypothetical protein